MNKKGRLVIISAPSGAGKGTVIREITRLRPEIKYSVSATTRAPRPGEVHGEHYFFVSPEEFDAMVERGEFLEHETYVGNSYGTPRGPIERNIADGIDTILEIEVKGARQVRGKIPDVISIFLAAPNEEELRRRLIGRGTSEDTELVKRLETAREELAASEEYAFTVVNDDATRAAREIIAILDFNREDYL
ncbi:MAG: guanylate kinase [Oscillospiraceae bacterium]|jgi:guanylate kinase|nr:guanylate kinase [Oscillospiraceae bacterium]